MRSSGGGCRSCRWDTLRYSLERAFRVLLLALLLGLGTTAIAQEQILVEAGSSMSYLANSTDPNVGLDWTSDPFDAGAWPTGTYGVGYDVNGSAANLINTTVPIGTLSIYTRATFNIQSAGNITSLFVGCDYDDSYAMWINGVEVFRSPELPAGPLDWNTPTGASEPSNGMLPNYAPYHDISTQAIPLLQDGDNLFAVGVWNFSAQSSDLVLVPQLVANKGLQLTRGPYLQSGTPTSMRIRWRTNVLEEGRVLYGLDPASLTSNLNDPLLTLDHEFLLTDLEPDTKYYYAIGNSQEILVGADLDHYFFTSPVPGTPKPTRIWVLGDSGNSAGSVPVRDAYMAVTGSQETDLWLMLGDNAYPSGTDEQYQLELFDIFPTMLRSSVLWPTIGNHDIPSGSSASQSEAYFKVFSLPRFGEAGGISSGTEAYYSFDYANIHFVVLDSHGTDRSPPNEGGVMLNWLQNDLALTDQDWIIAFWHHPPYSDGSHNSDTEIELIEMRQNAVPILESYGVDLVLAGHSHSYERSLLIDQHYGDSDTFGPQHILDGGSGREDEPDGPYQKPAGLIPHEGAVYTVAGTSGSISPTALEYPAMYVSWAELGSVILEVHGNRLDLSFLDTMENVLDYFTLIKGSYCPASDPDSDGACDGDDNCPSEYNPDQEDLDGDGQGDVCDPCPGDPDDDIDSDGLCGDEDNCPDDNNPNQENADGDALGDICDGCPDDPNNDGDGDGLCADVDNCPDDSNVNQEDADGDAIGDLCDICPTDPLNDGDGDGACGDVDNCPTHPNGTQLDSDSDGLGDPCDPCPLDPNNDADGDSFCSDADNCPGIPNDQGDADLDGLGDACDSCPLDPDNDFDADGVCGNVDNCPGATNPGQQDTDGDGVGNVCDNSNDLDGDSVSDGIDNCPANSNPTQQDTDGDGMGDACDADDDGDGIADAQDCASLSPGVSSMPGLIGPTLVLERSTGVTLHWERAEQGHVSNLYLGVSAGAGFPVDSLTCVGFGSPVTESDQFDEPLPGEVFYYVVSAVNLCGEGPLDEAATRSPLGACPMDAVDSDGDGTEDLADNCPLMPNPGLSDIDGDFVGDVCDNCPGISNPLQEDSNDDGTGNVCDGVSDSDGDGIADADDNCPDDPNSTQDDSDMDNQGDVCDPCPFDADNDLDSDGLCGDVDNCPADFNPGQADFDGDLQGDDCDADDDNDGVSDGLDPAPFNPDVCGDVDDDTCDDCFIGTDDLGPNPDSDPANDGPDFDADGLCDPGDADDDNDGVDDTDDSDPLNPNVCRDVDADTCDDCSSGSDDPANDGPDFDGDGACDAGDADDDNDGVDDIDDSDPLNPNVCRDVDADTCDDCSSGSDNPANDGADFDGDGACDAGDVDDDNDGVDDSDDSDPLNPNVCRDVDADTCDDCSSGSDDPANDGADFDGDGACDAGDADDDNDGVDDATDPSDFDPDVCGDSDGDTCDDCSIGTDDLGPLPDNDPANDGVDTDGDGACDAGDFDSDNDGVPDVDDADPLDPFVCRDVDADTCDDCSSGSDDPANDGADFDADGACDAGDADDDNDGVDDVDDSDPLNPNVCRDVDADTCDDCSSGSDDPANDGADFDADGACDAGDADDDNDGVDDVDDSDPLNPNVCRDVDADTCDDCSSGSDDPANDGPDFDADGACDAGDADDDNDGVDDVDDSDPLDPYVCRDVDADTCDDCSSGSDNRNNDGADFDGDGDCDDGDADDDNDGVNDAADPSDFDPDVCGDSDGDTCDDCSVGTDNLGPLPDTNPANDGADFDMDGLCDAGDPDDDNDGVEDTADADPFNRFVCRDVDADTCDDCSSGSDDPADDGPDNEGDGLCDAGDPDDDNDGILDNDDNCRFEFNPFQTDEDDDGSGDVCDDCPGDPFNDSDEDGLCTSDDNCPSVSNAAQSDRDGDGIGDLCEIVVVTGFRITATEVTNLDYVKFLSAVASTDPNGLFNTNMTVDPRGGIRRFGNAGNFTYEVKQNMGNKPVNYVAWLDTARYVNWLHNGMPTGAQGNGTTETGAYDLNVEDPGRNAVREVGANWFLPTKVEWDAAAYSDPNNRDGWKYPTRSDDSPEGALAGLTGDVTNPGLNVANYDKSAHWNGLVGNVTTVAGAGPLSTSYWGTYDQGGNVTEWVETLSIGNRWLRGGSYHDDKNDLRSDAVLTAPHDIERPDIGFRVASPSF